MRSIAVFSKYLRLLVIASNTFSVKSAHAEHLILLGVAINPICINIARLERT